MRAFIRLVIKHYKYNVESLPRRVEAVTAAKLSVYLECDVSKIPVGVMVRCPNTSVFIESLTSSFSLVL